MLLSELERAQRSVLDLRASIYHMSAWSRVGPPLGYMSTFLRLQANGVGRALRHYI